MYIDKIRTNYRSSTMQLCTCQFKVWCRTTSILVYHSQPSWIEYIDYWSYWCFQKKRHLRIISYINWTFATPPLGSHSALLLTKWANSPIESVTFHLNFHETNGDLSLPNIAKPPPSGSDVNLTSHVPHVLKSGSGHVLVVSFLPCGHTLWLTFVLLVLW